VTLWPYVPLLTTDIRGIVEALAPLVANHEDMAVTTDPSTSLRELLFVSSDGIHRDTTKSS